MIHISKDGTGDFESIQKALDSLPINNTDEKILYIHKGVYEEQITITTPHVTFLGEDKDNTIISYWFICTYGYGRRHETRNIPYLFLLHRYL